jgi:heat shock protein HslJ
MKLKNKTLKLAGLYSGLIALLITFQNCGSNTKFAGENNSNNNMKSSADKNAGNRVDSSVLGDYDVLAYEEQACKGNACSVARANFKSKQTLSLEANGIVKGKAACNGFGGAYTLKLRPDEGTHLIAFKNLQATMMGCDLLKEEQVLLDVLSQAYKISNSKNDVVYIYGTDSTLVLRRQVTNKLIPTPLPTPEPLDQSLVGSFSVVSYTSRGCSESGSLNSPCVLSRNLFASKQTIKFLGARLSGVAACNSFGAAFKSSVDKKTKKVLLKIDGIISTMRACSLISEENILFKALAEAQSVQFQANSITIVTKHGDLQLNRIK